MRWVCVFVTSNVLFFSRFSRIFDTNMLVSKTQVKAREKNQKREGKNASETTHSVNKALRPKSQF